MSIVKSIAQQKGQRDAAKLIDKYNVAGPRYTSYPTVPFWNVDAFDIDRWKQEVQNSFRHSNEEEGISLYIHLPYCESLCTFCACHKRITKNHAVELPYINALLKEWKLYLNLFGTKPKIKELHLGGGTPTFFQPKHLKKLINGILESATVCENHDFSFEAHPKNTTKAHLETLRSLGFKRLSLGIQDYDETVQKMIHRQQSFEEVKQVTDWAKSLGYNSISHDLVFGLPKQSLSSITKTINLTKILSPDRISFYSYAHVPWIKNNGQRGFNESDLPTANQKKKLYEVGKELLSELSYFDIGMDHFALEHDALYTAAKNKTMHRNFMGYTPYRTELMVGLGMSAIGDAWTSFAQNVKTVEQYIDLVNKNELPVFRGHHLTQKDLIVRQHVLNIMCHSETSWTNPELQFKELATVVDRLSPMVQDGLLSISKNGLKLKSDATAFVRNVCMAFDLRLINKRPQTQIFSMTI